MISIIIPTLNESSTLPSLLFFLKNAPSWNYITEIIVSDANSSDGTIAVAESFGATVVRNEIAGRAIQMNAGARAARGEILYFLHADSIPPSDYSFEILSRYNDGYDCGCFRLKFDDNHWFLKLNAWFTRFQFRWFRFGDQSLFVSRVAFMEIKGFSEEHKLLEDQEIIDRLSEAGKKFIVMEGRITTSARRYRTNGVFRLQGIYFYIYTLYRLGFSQKVLVDKYRKLIGKA